MSHTNDSNIKTSHAIEQLKSLLKQDLNDLDRLNQLLAEEKASLKTRDSVKIEQSSLIKSELIKQIDARAKLKAKTIANSGLGIKPGHVGEALKSLGDPGLSALWDESLEKLTLCKDENLVNGTIISHSIQRTSKLMTIIRGQSAAPNLYGQQGKSQSYSGSQMIGKA